MALWDLRMHTQFQYRGCSVILRLRSWRCGRSRIHPFNNKNVKVTTFKYKLGTVYYNKNSTDIHFWHRSLHQCAHAINTTWNSTCWVSPMAVPRNSCRSKTPFHSRRPSRPRIWCDLSVTSILCRILNDNGIRALKLWISSAAIKISYPSKPLVLLVDTTGVTLKFFSYPYTATEKK